MSNIYVEDALLSRNDLGGKISELFQENKMLKRDLNLMQLESVRMGETVEVDQGKLELMEKKIRFMKHEVDKIEEELASVHE